MSKLRRIQLIGILLFAILCAIGFGQETQVIHLNREWNGCTAVNQSKITAQTGPDDKNYRSIIGGQTIYTVEDCTHIKTKNWKILAAENLGGLPLHFVRLADQPNVIEKQVLTDHETNDPIQENSFIYFHARETKKLKFTEDLIDYLMEKNVKIIGTCEKSLADGQDAALAKKGIITVHNLKEGVNLDSKKQWKAFLNFIPSSITDKHVTAVIAVSGLEFKSTIPLHWPLNTKDLPSEPEAKTPPTYEQNKMTMTISDHYGTHIEAPYTSWDKGLDMSKLETHVVPCYKIDVREQKREGANIVKSLHIKNLEERDDNSVEKGSLVILDTDTHLKWPRSEYMSNYPEVEGKAIDTLYIQCQAGLVAIDTISMEKGNSNVLHRKISLLNKFFIENVGGQMKLIPFNKKQTCVIVYMKVEKATGSQTMIYALSDKAQSANEADCTKATQSLILIFLFACFIDLY